MELGGNIFFVSLPLSSNFSGTGRCVNECRMQGPIPGNVSKGGTYQFFDGKNFRMKQSNNWVQGEPANYRLQRLVSH
jgi:hypothetical protein